MQDVFHNYLNAKYTNDSIRTEHARITHDFYSQNMLGVPFNIASYSLLTHMIAQQCDLDVGEFIWTGGDCHNYLNHLEQVGLLLSREPYPLPKLVIKRSLRRFSNTSLKILRLSGINPTRVLLRLSRCDGGGIRPSRQPRARGGQYHLR